MLPNALRISGPLLLLGCALGLPSAAAGAAAAQGSLHLEDRAGLQEAHETARHAARPVERGHQAHNPGQRWTTTFDGRGFLTEPAAGDWNWGLDLLRYGFAGDEDEVTEPACVRVEGGRVVYEWDEGLEEWYVNDRRGLEHGYTVHRRPTRDGESEPSPLTLTLSIRGELRPEVESGGRGIRFLDESGATALTYTGLIVLDADGRPLNAGFELVAEGLLLSIDESGARYPLTIDPVAQQAYLKASNTDPSDHFGGSVAISGNTVVIGTFYEDSSATGVNGDEGDNSAGSSGAAYVFVRNGSSWSQEAYLKASNTDDDDFFGYSVALCGDTIVVGAPHEDGGSAGVNGDQSDDSVPWAGAAYVFVRNGTSWSQEAYLKASYPGTADEFGFSVAASDDRVFVGAFREDSSASGVNGDQSNDDSPGSGAVTVFTRSVLGWSQEAFLKASNPDSGDAFGFAVAAGDDLVVVATYQEASAATGVNGDQLDNSAFEAGAAYVFGRTAAGWSQEAYLKASNTEARDRFGYTAAAVSGDTVVIGAYAEDSAATGVNGDQSDNSLVDAGAAYVFVRNGSSWIQEAYLKASNPDDSDSFGLAVGVSGDTLVIGAPSEGSASAGVGGDQSDNSLTYAGAAYAFRRGPAGWSQDAYLKASNPDEYDRFGLVLAVSEDTLVVTSPNEDSSATGVNGDQSDEFGSDSGAAYVFDLDLPRPGTPYCFGDPGSGTPCPCSNDNDGTSPGSGCANGVFTTGAQLSGSGVASLSADTLVLTTIQLEPNNSGLYFQADNDLSPGLVWGDGLRCAGGDLRRLEVRFADAAGISSTTIGLSAKAGNVQAGDTKYYQCWYRTNVNPPCGLWVNDFNTSNGYLVTWAL